MKVQKGKVMKAKTVSPVAKKAKAVVKKPKEKFIMVTVRKDGTFQHPRQPKKFVAKEHAAWTKQEEAVLSKLDTPAKIQEFVDKMAYDSADDYFSVRYTLRTRRGHCMGGAMVAACCLERLGLGQPRVVSIEAKNDDSHAIAVYQKNGYWGAIGKSNFTLIRSRQPVYKSLRELMMSYFDFYFNTKREMSMVAYSDPPFNLNWTGNTWKFAEGSTGKDLDDFDDEDVQAITKVRPPGMKKKDLGLASKFVLKAGLLGSSSAGLYKPR